MPRPTPLQIELPLWPALAAPPAATPGESLRRVLLGERWVDYRLRRARGRRLALTIDADGLRIGAPLSLPVHDIEAFAYANAAWILQKLDDWGGRPRRQVVVVTDGIRVPVLDGEITVRLCAATSRARRAGETLWLPVGEAAGQLEKALRELARAEFAPRVSRAAATLGVAMPRLTIGAARTRWGSCSLRSGIRLNWRLLHFPPAIADYVIAHEVAHLREMNHSPRFWRVVESLCPGYQAARRALRDEADGLPFYA